MLIFKQGPIKYSQPFSIYSENLKNKKNGDFRGKLGDRWHNPSFFHVTVDGAIQESEPSIFTPE